MTDIPFPTASTLSAPMAARNHSVSDQGNDEREEWRKSLQERIIRGLDACAAKGMTRDGIGADMGYQSAQPGGILSKWYTGRVTPDAQSIAKLARATGLSADWLLVERGPMFAPEIVDALRLELIEAIASRRVPDSVVRELVDPTPSPGDNGAGRDDVLRRHLDGEPPSPDPDDPDEPPPPDGSTE